MLEGVDGKKPAEIKRKREVLFQKVMYGETTKGRFRDPAELFKSK